MVHAFIPILYIIIPPALPLLPLLWIIMLDRKCTFQRLHESLCCTLDCCWFFPLSAGNLQDDGPQDEGLKVSSKKKANQGIRKRIVTHLTKVLASANLCLLFKLKS